ncbi:hypothetical protein Pint_24188 [Pistacia integerrima]|uniref:Uncharacterized protein n=1 Tax=Pistacia integerrima TaxID=434235 RepID=A0ACC0YFB3_9ROSI|nr:hypothetical protein Pint_24188 [Pistacia integerrima]
MLNSRRETPYDENGTAYDDEYKDDIIDDYEDGNAEGKYGSMELLSMADMEPAKAGAATDDAGDMNFFDDESE